MSWWWLVTILAVPPALTAGYVVWIALIVWREQPPSIH
jgi:hypothetical protein